MDALLRPWLAALPPPTPPPPPLAGSAAGVRAFFPAHSEQIASSDDKSNSEQSVPAADAEGEAALSPDRGDAAASPLGGAVELRRPWDDAASRPASVGCAGFFPAPAASTASAASAASAAASSLSGGSQPAPSWAPPATPPAPPLARTPRSRSVRRRGGGAARRASSPSGDDALARGRGHSRPQAAASPARSPRLLSAGPPTAPPGLLSAGPPTAPPGLLSAGSPTAPPGLLSAGPPTALPGLLSAGSPTAPPGPHAADCAAFPSPASPSAARPWSRASPSRAFLAAGCPSLLAKLEAALSPRLLVSSPAVPPRAGAAGVPALFVSRVPDGLRTLLDVCESHGGRAALEGDEAEDRSAPFPPPPRYRGDADADLCERRGSRAVKSEAEITRTPFGAERAPDAGLGASLDGPGARPPPSGAPRPPAASGPRAAVRAAALSAPSPSCSFVALAANRGAATLPLALARAPAPASAHSRGSTASGPCQNPNCERPDVSPQWRKGPPECPVLCNACGTRWLRNGTLEPLVPRRGVRRARADADGAKGAPATRRRKPNAAREAARWEG